MDKEYQDTLDNKECQDILFETVKEQLELMSNNLDNAVIHTMNYTLMRVDDGVKLELHIKIGK